MEEAILIGSRAAAIDMGREFRKVYANADHDLIMSPNLFLSKHASTFLSHCIFFCEICNGRQFNDESDEIRENIAMHRAAKCY